jgi:crossover junction endodeoxyribonuclease RuvC
MLNNEKSLRLSLKQKAIQSLDEVSQVVAVDPGKSGAVAVLGREDSTTLSLKVARDFKYQQQLNNVPDQLLTSYTLVIELVHSMPRQGVASTFTFGDWNGFLKGLLYPHAKQVIFYDPKRWQNHVRKSLMLERMPPDWRQVAVQLFPQQEHLFKRVKDHNTADAVMIGMAYLWGAAPSTPIIKRSDPLRHCVLTA